MKKQAFKGLLGGIDKNSPAILTGLGCVGVVSTAILAVKATPKAHAILERLKEEASDEGVKLKKWTVVKETWKCYIPTAIMAAATISCVLGANSISTKRNAAIAGAYAILDKKFTDFKGDVIETFSKKQAKNDERTVQEKINDTANARRLKENPLDHEVILSDDEQLCYDAYSGRYFKSTINKLDSIFVDLSRRLMNDHTVTLNEYFFEIGIESSRSGDTLAWHIDRGLISPRYSSQLATDGRACIVVNFETDPTYIDFN